MERFYKYIILFILPTLLLVSCQNEENIGDFYGQWALKQSCVDDQIKEYNNLYMSFQGKVAWAKRVNEANHTYGDVFGNVTFQGDSIFIRFIQQNESTSLKSLIEDDFRFKNADNARFMIYSISKSKLCLTLGNDKWLFEKY